MVLDLDLFRQDKGGDPERVKANARKRFDNVDNVEKVMDLDAQWRKLRWSMDQLNKAKNTISKEYGIRMKASKGKQSATQDKSSPKQSSVQGDSIAPLDLSSLFSAINSIDAQVDLEQLKNLRAQVEAQVVLVNQQLDECEANRDEILREIGNLIHPNVPISDNEDNNAVVRTYGKILTPQDIGVDALLSHVDLLELIGGVDSEKAPAISGSRGYFLKGPGVWLQQAIIQYALRFISQKEYEPIYCPFWMRKNIMGQVAQLNQFDEELYKIVSSKDAEDSDEKYLIATSEQPLAAYHMNEWLSASVLPLKYGGLSTCFRQEVGSHGRDTRGIFRVHQFEKIEQFVITAPSKSWESFDEMIGNAETFYQTLKIPYQVVNIVSGALNNAASMKYDLEAFFPGSKAYRELVSVSNCTDYQARRLQVRYGLTKKMGGQTEYVHMLNGTLCAVTRCLCCILENYQVKDGIKIPDVLQEFMPQKYKEFIPFIQELKTNLNAASCPP